MFVYLSACKLVLLSAYLSACLCIYLFVFMLCRENHAALNLNFVEHLKRNFTNRNQFGAPQRRRSRHFPRETSTEYKKSRHRYAGGNTIRSKDTLERKSKIEFTVGVWQSTGKTGIKWKISINRNFITTGAANSNWSRSGAFNWRKSIIWLMRQQRQSVSVNSSTFHNQRAAWNRKRK